VGTLFVVATPIGNLEDVTPRALRVLTEVSLIAAEDTRRTGNLLRHFGITTPTVSYHGHNERQRRNRLLDALAAGDVALVTDAGTPGISDPGNDIVAAAHASGYPVSPVPGPSSLTAAVSVSGLVPGPFVALGFLPRQASRRRLAIARAASAAMPFVLFEAPGRVASTLGELRDALGARPGVVLRELTKVYEEVRPGLLADLADWAAANEPRGEVIIVVGASAQTTGRMRTTTSWRWWRRCGGRSVASAAAREAASMSGLPRSQVYEVARSWRPDSDEIPNLNAERDAR
jgi:16S rRNA (cytidine1402-2'-O)-methyltransferase